MSEAKAVFEAIVEAERAGVICALATVIRSQGSVPRQAGSKMLVYEDGRIVGTVGGGVMEARAVAEAQTIMRTGQPNTFTYNLNDLGVGDPGICGGTVEIFIEPIGFMPTVVVIGCGHVGKALAELAKWSGFRVVVSDDRAELCTPEHIPAMDDYMVCSPAELPQRITINHLTYIAAVTRGLPVDIDLFPPLLATEAAYIGLIGSKRRWELTQIALIEKGLDAAKVAAIHAPIGLDIRAETPQEIAISIMGEIIQQYRSTTGRKRRR